MKVTLIGFTRKTGEFNGSKFDNVNLFVVKDLDDERKDTFGKEPIITKTGRPPKMKTALLAAQLGIGVPELTSTLAEYVGQEIDIFFDMFGAIEEIYLDK